MLKKTMVFFALGLVLHLYTTFVLMILWNWFVTAAFHVDEISFWLMYGLGLVVQLFQNPGDEHFDDERRFNRLTIMIDACVPDSMREYVKDELQEQNSGMWLDIGTTLFGRFVGNTFTLCVAFVVHIFAT
jgi:hypothetical protein